MTISELDRIKLHNQYCILHELQGDQGWRVLAEIVQNGYEGEYYRIEQTVFEPLSEDECREVNDILGMFDALQRPYSDSGQQVPDSVKFPGFDGNNEGHVLSYFKFMRATDGKWTYISVVNENDLNSHFPVLDGYRRMLATWQSMNSPMDLNDEQIEAILAERIHPDNRK